MALCKKKTEKLWLWRAYDPIARRTIAWVLGRRDDATCQKLLNKIGLEGKTFVTDDWEGYHRLIPDDQLFTDSPENRSFFGEGVKVVVEVVLDLSDRSTISTTLETTFVRRRNHARKWHVAVVLFDWDGQVFASSKPPLTYATFMRAAKVRNGPIMPL